MPSSPSRSSGRRLIVAVAIMVVVVLVAVWRWRAGASESTSTSASELPREIEPTMSRPDEGEPDGTPVAGSLAGHVYGSGQPLAGAQVCAWALGDDEVPRDPFARLCTQTDADGHYRLAAVPPGRHRVSASAARHLPGDWHEGERTSLLLHVDEARTGVDLQLVPGGVRIAGVVEDVAGGPIAQALLVASGRRGASARTSTVSDDDGHFELWVAPGELLVWARADGYADTNRYFSAPNEAVVLTLSPESVLLGRVVDAQTLAGLEGVTVSPDPSSQLTVTSGEDGRFELHGLRPGRYQPQAIGEQVYGLYPRTIQLGLGQTSEPIELRVHPAFALHGQLIARALDGSERGCAEGHVDVSGGGFERHVQADAEGHVTIPGLPGGRYQVRPVCPTQLGPEPSDLVVGPDTPAQRWLFEAGLAISGTVTDAQGRAAPNLYVHTEGPSGGTITWTDADGHFELAGLRPGHYAVWLRNHDDRTLDVELVDRNVDGLALEAGESGRVRAIVRDDADRPIAGVHVQVQGADGRSFGQRMTDGEGRAEIAGLTPGRVRVSLGGSGPDATKGVPVEIRAGEVSEVELRGETRVGSISGRVLEDGGPVSDAWVVAGRSISEGEFEIGPLLCEQDGRFVLDDLPDGSWTVRAYRDAGGQATVEGVALGNDIKLSLEGAASLSGVVRFADGSTPEHVSIELSPGEPARSLTASFYRTDGRFEFDGLAPGTWTVSAEASNGAAERELELAADEHGSLELELDARTTIRGRIVDAITREPVTSLEVQLQSSRRGFARRVRTDADGRFVLDGIPIGRVQLMLLPKNWGTGRYNMQSRILVVDPSLAEQDVGDLAVVGRRSSPGRTPGELGFAYAFDGSFRPDEVDRVRVVVESVAAQGPAAAAGLRVGDVITSVDGASVVGQDAAHMRVLLRVDAGTTVQLERAEGEPVTIVAR